MSGRMAKGGRFPGEPSFAFFINNSGESPPAKIGNRYGR